MGLAENITLNFRFVTFDTDFATQSIGTADDLTFDAVKSVGAAIFNDGRVATKKYVWVSSSADWVSHGRSAYTFENGDTIVARFVSQPVGEGFVGEYEVMSGTGIRCRDFCYMIGPAQHEYQVFSCLFWRSFRAAVP